VTHNTRPFKNRARVTPEVASKPQRLEHDLNQIKRLASVLEDEAAVLRKFKPAPQKPKEAEGEDSAMAILDEEQEEEDPSERGSDAVERRIEKIMSDLRDQGIVDVNDEKTYELKKVCSIQCQKSINWYGIRSQCLFGFSIVQTTVALDLYLAYLRASYHTCYYCSVVTDHLEELQRKCLRHSRKPLSKLLLDEVKAEEAAESKKNDEDGAQDQEPSSPVEGEPAPATTDGEKKEKVPAGKRQDQGRDWKRNGKRCVCVCVGLYDTDNVSLSSDEKWLDWLDSKVALLIDRNGVDPKEYGGKNYDEYVIEVTFSSVTFTDVPTSRELTKAVEPQIKQEDEGKFRCKLCSKLFKATSFVEKHVANKHAEQLKALDDVSDSQ
jgi:hypothetical protein